MRGSPRQRTLAPPRVCAGRCTWSHTRGAPRRASARTSNTSRHPKGVGCSRTPRWLASPAGRSPSSTTATTSRPLTGPRCSRGEAPACVARRSMSSLSASSLSAATAPNLPRAASTQRTRTSPASAWATGRPCAIGTPWWESYARAEWASSRASRQATTTRVYGRGTRRTPSTGAAGTCTGSDGRARCASSDAPAGAEGTCWA
mmetsp:Transcript_4290/g.17246  ORF Transcript_4290/g.17246 Transcript_4290/m.17246 type:complete len:203 (-) Transcript_4290:175-783(-)